MASELGVQTIQHTNGTDALTVGSGGVVTAAQYTLSTTRPMMCVRGVNTSASNTGPFANFVEVTGWDTTDVNVGDCLQNGRFRAPVNGIYNLNCFTTRAASTDYRYTAMYHYDGTTYTRIMTGYTNNSYSGNGMGFGNILYSMGAGDEILVGWSSAYAAWEGNDESTMFSCYLMG
jgi:hypothetical protein